MEIKYFDRSKSQLEIQGIPIHEIVNRTGGTPFYLYDRASILKRISELKKVASPTIEIHYALKANPMPALICLLANQIDGFDVASAKELKLALDSGMSPQNISFAGPGKTVHELKQALASRVLINIESENEYLRLKEIEKELKITPRIGLRVNTAFEMKASGMKMAGGAKPFGIDSESVPLLIERIQNQGDSIEGLHFYSGSQCLDAKTIIEAQNLSLEFAGSLSGQIGSTLKTLNLGGGFGIPYFENDAPLDLDSVFLSLNKKVQLLPKNYPNAKIVLELGRYLVGESGIYVAKVIDKKVSRGKTFLVLDGGMNHHLSASGNLGQIIKKNYPIMSSVSDPTNQKEIVTIVGPLCTPLDTLATDLSINFCQVGDLIVFFQSGAYGLTASPQDFLSHNKIEEILF